MLDDLGRDFDQRLIAALQAFHEPAGFLQLFFDIAPVGRRSIAEHRYIVIIHSQSRRHSEFSSTCQRPSRSRTNTSGET